MKKAVYPRKTRNTLNKSVCCVINLVGRAARQRGVRSRCILSPGEGAHGTPYCCSTRRRSAPHCVPTPERSSLYTNVQVHLVPTCYVGMQCWTRCVRYTQTLPVTRGAARLDGIPTRRVGTRKAPAWELASACLPQNLIVQVENLAMQCDRKYLSRRIIR